MATRLLLIRHAQSEWNASGRWQGWADPPLSDGGASACVAARDDPLLDQVGAIASSDLKRAWSSAEILAEGRDWGELTRLRGLRERSAGDWTGLTRDEIDQRWPGVLATPPAVIPGGEQVAAVTARAVAALHRVADQHPDRTVLVVSHGALIRAVAHHLGAAPERIPNLGGLWLEVAAGRLRPGAAAGPLGAGVSSSRAEGVRG